MCDCNFKGNQSMIPLIISDHHMNYSYDFVPCSILADIESKHKHVKSKEAPSKSTFSDSLEIL